MSFVIDLLRVELAKNLERRKHIFHLAKDVYTERRNKLICEEQQIREAISILKKHETSDESNSI